VIYNKGTGASIWASNTATPNPGQCFIQYDGNLVLYTAAGDAYWASDTTNKGVGPYKLVLQDSGVANIVDGTGANIWASQ
jgi:hypothetical protein